MISYFTPLHYVLLASFRGFSIQNKLQKPTLIWIAEII